MAAVEAENGHVSGVKVKIQAVSSTETVADKHTAPEMTQNA